MLNLLRREVVETARTVVIKIGTNVLSLDDGRLNLGRVEKIAEQVHAIIESGKRVVLVSSGAVGAGMDRLGLSRRPDDLPHLQAAAATGQAYLISCYDQALQKYGYHAAQLLLTTDDFNSRTRYLNMRNTLRTLFELGTVPIINENDTVSVDEIKFGDNDSLAALVTNLAESPLMVILTGVDGLFDGNPSYPESRVIPLVQSWDDDIFQHVANVKSQLGTGGMGAKLQSIKAATAVGENVIIANGHNDSVLLDILAGKEVGTLFVAQGPALTAWKRWLGYAVTPEGRITLDSGACRAVCDSGKSLLAVGIVKSEGQFVMGDVVSILASDGAEIGRGLTNYDSGIVSKISGRNKSEIAEILGDVPFQEVIHRDNMVIRT